MKEFKKFLIGSVFITTLFTVMCLTILFAPWVLPAIVMVFVFLTLSYMFGEVIMEEYEDYKNAR